MGELSLTKHISCLKKTALPVGRLHTHHREGVSGYDRLFNRDFGNTAPALVWSRMRNILRRLIDAPAD